MDYVYIIVGILGLFRVGHFFSESVENTNILALVFAFIDICFTIILLSFETDNNNNIYPFIWTGYFCVVYVSTLYIELYKAMHDCSNTIEIYQESIDFSYTKFNTAFWNNSFLFIIKPYSYIANSLMHRIIKLKYKKTK